MMSFWYHGRFKSKNGLLYTNLCIGQAAAPVCWAATAAWACSLPPLPCMPLTVTTLLYIYGRR